MNGRSVLRACDALERGCLEEVLELLPEDAEPATDSLRLAARGLQHERAGLLEEARTCFRAVHAHSVPLPGLLRVAAAALQRLGEPGCAHDCVMILEGVRPGSARDFSMRLPVAEQVRYLAFLVPTLLHAPRPLLYSLQPLKEELVRQLGPEAGAAWAAAARLHRPTIAPRQVATLSSYATQHGLDFQEVAPARDVLLSPPAVFGQPAGSPRPVRTRRLWWCVLRDVVVSGKSNLLFVDDSALLDAQREELELYPLNLDVDPSVVAPTGSTVQAVLATPTLFVDQALSLLGVHSYNFGHWLVEFLPKVWWCLNQPGFEHVTVLVDEQKHRELLPALLSFLPPGHPVQVVAPGQAVQVDRLWTMPMVTYFPLGPRAGSSDTDAPPPIDATFMASLVRQLPLDTPPPSRRLYLSRGDDQHRRLVNRAEVESLVARRGFEVYDPGSLSFAEQLLRVRSARTILGPDGSALWLAFLAQPGTAVGYLDNPYLEEHWWIADVHRALGHRMTVLTGPVVNEAASYRKFSDYTIDLGQLSDYLDGLTD